jgi:hypothetical protein
MAIKKKEVKKWIPKKLKKGALSKQLGIEEKDNIPFGLLDKIIKAKPGDTIKNPYKVGKKKIVVNRQMERRAIFAKNLKTMTRKRKRQRLKK